MNDLKSFIAFAISQQLSDVRDDIKRLENRFDGLENRFDGLENKFDGVEKKVDDGFKRLDDKIDNLSDSVAQAIHDSNEEVDNQLKDHESRITALESKPA